MNLSIILGTVGIPQIILLSLIPIAIFFSGYALGHSRAKNKYKN